MGRKSAVCGHVHVQVCSVSPGRGARTGDLVRLAGVCSSRHSLREAVPCSVRPGRWPCCEVSEAVALSRGLRREAHVRLLPEAGRGRPPRSPLL